MMNSRELRIGNLVIDEIDKINTITLDTFRRLCECSIDELDLKPIPLTEEWLLRLGFEKERTYYTWYKRGVIYINCFNGEAYKLNTGGYTPYSSFKYVHQLQNLYFALTNEELTYENN